VLTSYIHLACSQLPHSMQAPHAVITPNPTRTTHFLGPQPSTPQIVNLPFGYTVQQGGTQPHINQQQPNQATTPSHHDAATQTSDHQSGNRGHIDQQQPNQTNTTSYEDAGTQTSDNEAEFPGTGRQPTQSQAKLKDEDEEDNEDKKEGKKNAGDERGDHEENNRPIIRRGKRRVIESCERCHREHVPHSLKPLLTCRSSP
jgi:hypothetical protein